jgi:predicted acylesterase/phospholipase RssA
MLPLQRLQDAQKPGWLFAGGSSRCVFQVGVVETLLSLGLQPAMCLGVSGGAWNAAAVAAGTGPRLRAYWRFFSRMPYFDPANMLREHSPFIWPRIHRRAYDRYVGDERLRDASVDALIALTRLRDNQQLIVDIRTAPDPFAVLLASNFLPPFYTHAPAIDGERCGDGGWANNVPYEVLLDRGCDLVVVIAPKGESEGGLYRNADDYDHEIPHELRDRVLLIRPRHRLPIAFVERRWNRLAPIAEVGALRAREILLGERHAGTDVAARGFALTLQLARGRRWLKGIIDGKTRIRRGAPRPDGMPDGGPA